MKNCPLLYIGARYLDLVRSDAERFCPDLPFEYFASVDDAQPSLETVKYAAIVIDDGAIEGDVVAMLASLEPDDAPNGATPVRVLALRGCTWSKKIAKAYDNVMVIPDESSPADDPFAAIL